MAKHHLSQAAFERLTSEHHDLTTRGRIDVANKIEAARLMGDLSENGDYHAAKDEQGHMEGRIRHLEHLLDPDNHEIITPGGDGSVRPGSIITILYDGDRDDMAERYLIGHPEEQTEHDIVSPQSPLGAALIGKVDGDEVEYQGPHGVLKVKLLEVESA
jgi:transcription elongation factor GreA